VIWDTFLFHDELDVLECRLVELESLPVRHVVVEADVDHRGNPKQLVYQLNQDRFAAWSGRIIPVVATGLPTPAQTGDAWAREGAQREFARAGLLKAEPDDLVLHGDVDEIPRASAVAEAMRLTEAGGAATMIMRVHQYAVDWLSDFEDLTTVAVRYGNLPPSVNDFRRGKHGYARIERAGWHITSLGPHEAVMRKLHRHCHLEQTVEEYERAASGRSYREGYTHGGTHQAGVTVTEDWPRYVYEHRCPEHWFRPRETP
jgi:hypothetical protein